MFDMQENDKCEFKEIANELLAKEIVGFLNTNGGSIYVGINNNGEVIGIRNDKMDETMKKVSDIITDQILPRCVEFVNVVKETIDEKEVIKIDITKGSKLYYQKKYGLSTRGCFVRIGTSTRGLSTEEIEKRFIDSLNIPEKDICEIEAYWQNLTFTHLKNYLLSNGNHINEDTFLQNYKLVTSNGKYNRLAELLADKNDIIVNVMTFKGKDKVDYLKRNEFGYTCLLLAYEKAKNYVDSLNETYVKVGVTPRKEKKMFDPNAFEQAWVNACVHNKWSESNHPGIYIYSDRMVIESQGGIPKGLSKENFLKGVSQPVNKALMDIFIKCNFCEESGHGVPQVVKKYGDEAYDFLGNFIDVTIPFDKKGFVDNVHNNVHNNVHDNLFKIKSLIRNNSKISMIEMANLLGVSKKTIQRVIGSTNDIVRVGNNKSGYWKIISGGEKE